MKKIFITVILVVIVFVGYWLISPFFIDVRVSESFPAELLSQVDGQVDGQITRNPIEDAVVMTGNFVGFDKIHNGTGTVSIYSSKNKRGDTSSSDIKTILRFEEGFQVNNGPDLYVGFGKNGKYVKGSEISKLKGNIGAQNYDIEGVDLNQYDSVWVWCKAFSTPFIKADLNHVAENITYKKATADLIQVTLPFPDAVVGKDFSVIGKARGNWFFEASFPVEVLDKNGKILAIGIAHTINGEDWMTTNFVNFKADIKVPQSYIGPATLVLKKDNPSGLAEHDASVLFPINIEY
ncbi:MAG: DM13 domain-containing protein [Candidatus Pacebacteria bacterium]|nr:DM13 domain-containing protein [Candidatus Paceibacterota bacterium]